MARENLLRCGSGVHMFGSRQGAGKSIFHRLGLALHGLYHSSLEMILLNSSFPEHGSLLGAVGPGHKGLGITGLINRIAGLSEPKSPAGGRFESAILENQAVGHGRFTRFDQLHPKGLAIQLAGCGHGGMLGWAGSTSTRIGSAGPRGAAPQEKQSHNQKQAGEFGER